MDSPLASTYGNRVDRALSSANDYHNERHRINKRLAKLRASLSLKNKNTKNFKKREFSKEDFEKNNKVGDVLLLTIERDVLFALETRVIIEVQSSKAKENFIKSKYRRAIANSIKLLSIIESAEDSIKLQTYIYSAIIQGSYSIFRRKWDQASYSLSLARVGLQCLSSQNYPQKEILVDIIDNVIDPSLKLSLYNSSSTQSSSPDLNQISKKESIKNLIPHLSPLLNFVDSKFLEQEDENMDTIKEISWSNYTASIHDDDTSRLIMIAEKNSSNLSDASSYDPALLSWQDLLDHHSTEIEKKPELSDEEIQDNQILLTYINYKLNFLKIERDLVLIKGIESKGLNKSSLKKSLKILDNVLLTLQNIKELPGVYNDENIWKKLEIYEKYYEIVKINKLCESYLIARKFKESLLLLNESSKLIQSIDFTDSLNNVDSKELPTPDQLTVMSKDIATGLLNLQVLSEYYLKAAGAKNQYYIDNLKLVPSNMDKLVNIKEFQMLHQKPVLFDIAFNYIDYSGQAEQENKEKKTFFGLFGGNR